MHETNIKAKEVHISAVFTCKSALAIFLCEGHG